MEVEKRKLLHSHVLFLFFFFFFFFNMVSSHNVPAVFIFGDSTLDAGNNHFNKNCSVQADFPPYGQDFFGRRPTGRFTNGRTVADFISEFLRIEIQKPYLEVEMEVRNGRRKSYPLNGINFASAGSGVLNKTNQEMGVTPLQTQVDQFTSLVKLNKLDKPTISRSLFLLESGSNDVFRYFLPIGPPRPQPDAYVSAMLSSVRAFTRQVHALGARRIALFSLGPVGCIPARALLPESSPLGACHPEMNRMARRFNRGLEGIVGSAPMTLPGAVAVYGATYDVVQLFRKLPKRYRFADTGSACCGSGMLGGMGQCGMGNYTVCGEPEKFLFWDFFHPSQHAYALISKAFWGGRPSRIRPMNLRQLAELNVSAV